ncbi:MAG TPA: FAD-dependent oxidoreductase [Acidimicrobiia bacterium]|nr:FAD-dependent oxidoreductase [Acidimicrobiia bacterium]
MSELSSPWLREERPPHPSLVAQETADAVVVGGGITGLTTALRLAQTGARVIVVEAGRLAGGTTGHTTAKVTSQHGSSYRRLIRHHGEEAARRYAQANQRAIETVARLATGGDEDCGFVRAPAFIYALTADETADLEAECSAAVGLGLPARLTTDTGLPFSVEAALVYDDQAYIDPVGYCHAIARALTAEGGVIFEDSPVTDIEEDGSIVRCHVGGSSVTAKVAVIATLLPIVDRGGFFAKTRPSRSYGIAGKFGQPPPAGMFISAGSPTRSLRPWPEGGETGFIIVGEGHETGAAKATPDRWRALETWATDNFDVESFDHRWSAQDYSTADSIPYVGRSPLTQNVYVATGFRKWGLTNATVAADILAAAIAGTDHPDADVFDASRIGGVRAIGTIIKDNVHVAGHLVGDRVARLLAPSIIDMSPGEGRIVKADGHTLAAHRTADGVFKVVSATCTHMGCTVKWNEAETSWDCPCHGSRFDVDGRVLNAPATRPLQAVDVTFETPGELEQQTTD